MNPGGRQGNEMFVRNSDQRPTPRFEPRVSPEAAIGGFRHTEERSRFNSLQSQQNFKR